MNKLIKVILFLIVGMVQAFAWGGLRGDMLAKELDEEDFIKEKYYLEVSSPGIDRPLKKDKDLTAHYGSKVDLAFFAPFEGKKQLTAVLKAHDADHLVVEDGKGTERTIERKLVASVRPHIDF